MKKLLKIMHADFLTHCIEPAVLLFAASKWLFDMIIPNAIELQYCSSVFNVSKQECFNRSLKYNEETQKVVTELNIIRSCFETFAPIFVLIMVGPWIETYGHRILIISSTIGYSIMSVCWTIASLFQNFNPYYSIFFSVPMMAGGTPLTIFVIDCYICHITSPENRSFRFGIVSVSYFAGCFIGAWLCSILDEFNYSSRFLIVTILTQLACFYSYFIIEEPETFTKLPVNFRRDSFSLSTNMKKILPSSFSKLTNRMRIIIIILGVVFVLGMNFIVGTRTIEYLFLQRTQSWTLNMFSKLMSFSILSHCIVGLLGTWWLNKKLRLSDLHSLIIVAISQFFAMIIFANSTDVWQVYLSGVFKSTYSLFVPTIKSFLSKVVFKEDIGKMLTTVIILGQLSVFIAEIFFNALYEQALSTSPSIPFNISAIMAYIMSCCILLANELYKKEASRDYDIIM